MPYSYLCGRNMARLTCKVKLTPGMLVSEKLQFLGQWQEDGVNMQSICDVSAPDNLHFLE